MSNIETLDSRVKTITICTGTFLSMMKTASMVVGSIKYFKQL